MTVRHESEFILFGHPLRVWSYKLKPGKPHFIGFGDDGEVYKSRREYDEVELLLSTENTGMIRTVVIYEGRRTDRVRVLQHVNRNEISRQLLRYGSDRFGYRERLVWKETKQKNR